MDTATLEKIVLRAVEALENIGVTAAQAIANDHQTVLKLPSTSPGAAQRIATEKARQSENTDANTPLADNTKRAAPKASKKTPEPATAPAPVETHAPEQKPDAPTAEETPPAESPETSVASEPAAEPEAPKAKYPVMLPGGEVVFASDDIDEFKSVLSDILDKQGTPAEVKAVMKANESLIKALPENHRSDVTGAAKAILVGMTPATADKAAPASVPKAAAPAPTKDGQNADRAAINLRLVVLGKLNYSEAISLLRKYDGAKHLDKIPDEHLASVASDIEAKIAEMEAAAKKDAK